MMKITLNVDCTPQEARTFFGLPDVQPVNDMIVSAMVERTRENIDSLSDPTQFWERTMAASGTGMAAFNQMMAAAMGPKGSKED